jgi:hypothetical protein
VLVCFSSSADSLSDNNIKKWQQDTYWIMIGMTTTVSTFNKPGLSCFDDHSFCDFTTVMIIMMIIKTMTIVSHHQDKMSFGRRFSEMSVLILIFKMFTLLDALFSTKTA